MTRPGVLPVRIHLSTTLALLLLITAPSVLWDAGFTKAAEPPKDEFPIDVSWLSPLFIEVRVNGSEPMRFILDSASTYSMIRTKEAQALGLKATNGTTLIGGGGAFRLDFAKADLQVGHTNLRNVELGVAELPSAYAGIVGGDLFEAYVVEVDYVRGRGTLFDPSTFRAPVNAKAIPLNIRTRIPSLQASVRFGNTTATGEFRIDTASGAPITLHHPFAERNSFPPLRARTQSSKSDSLGGSVDWVKARATSVSIGLVTFDKPIIASFATSRGAGGDTVIAGMIGNEILRRFRITFDCPHRRMFLAPNETSNRPFEVDMSGLGFGPSYRIFSVVPGSVAEKAGLKVDDVITKLDGEPVAEFGLAGAHDQLMRNGARCKIEVRRGERVVGATLQLKRLL